MESINEKSQQLKNRWQVKNTNTQSHLMSAIRREQPNALQDLVALPRASGNTTTLLP